MGWKICAAFLGVVSPLMAGVLEIEGKLLQATPTPELTQIAPYPRALCTFLYQVRKVHAGSYAGEKILVVKWAVWNKAKVPGVPGKIGSIERLKLDPWVEHPELARERIVDAIGELDLPMYYAGASRPGVVPNAARSKD